MRAMVLVVRRGCIAQLCLDRFEMLNASGHVRTDGLIAIVDAVEADRSVYVAILTGTGERAFHAGSY